MDDMTITHINKPKRIGVKRQAAIDKAVEYALRIDIRVAGVTRNNWNVTTKMCVDYQVKQHTLACSVVGNWKYYDLGKGKKIHSEFRLEGITVTHYPY